MAHRSVIAFILAVSAATAGAEKARIADTGSSRLPRVIAEAAFAFIGTPYVFGGIDGSGLDCSGLVYAVFKGAAGIELSRTVTGLFAAGTDSGQSPRPGDLVFFDTDAEDGTPPSPSKPSHVGIFIGGMRFVHSASEGPSTGVIVSSLEQKYYAARFVGFRRVLHWRAPVLELPMDGDGESVSASESIGSGVPIEVRIIGASSAGVETVFITAIRDGTLAFTRRLVLSAKEPASFPMFADEGGWSVTLASSTRGRICSIQFTVGE
jgi:hypothetical protein